jgi:hypothetical protein
MCAQVQTGRPARWLSIQPVLDEFQSKLAPSVPSLGLVQAVDRHWSDAEYRSRRPNGFPSGLRGVYLIFDEGPHLQYVGVAMWNFDKRVWAHDGHLERRWIDIVPFPEGHVFLAPALECLMIARLNPPCNTHYRGYSL